MCSRGLEHGAVLLFFFRSLRTIKQIRFLRSRRFPSRERRFFIVEKSSLAKGGKGRKGESVKTGDEIQKSEYRESREHKAKKEFRFFEKKRSFKMILRSVKSWVVVFGFLFLASSSAIAEKFTVGTGQNSAGLYIEWSDGYIAEFAVRFESVSITGLNLFDMVEASLGLTTVRLNYGTSVFIDGISFNGHSNIGYGGGENWWHQWIKNGDGNWEWGSGVSERILNNGDSDGWIYGRAGEPVPEPLSVALFGLSGLILSRCRRQRRIS